jgi:hypothetical protein
MKKKGGQKKGAGKEDSDGSMHIDDFDLPIRNQEDEEAKKKEQQKQ